MSEEAQEAVRVAWAAYRNADRPATNSAADDLYEALVAGFAAGVTQGIRQAREAVAEDLATIENGGGGVLRTWSDRGVTLGPMPGEVADAITRVIAKAATGFAD